MKKLIIMVTVVLAVFVFTGCASVNPSNTFYTTGTQAMEVRAEATNTVWLGMFGDGTYPLAEQIARDNGIARIALIERSYRLGVFGLWVEYTTVVIGESGGNIVDLTPVVEVEIEIEVEFVVEENE